VILAIDNFEVEDKGCLKTNSDTIFKRSEDMELTKMSVTEGFNLKSLEEQIKLGEKYHGVLRMKSFESVGGMSVNGKNLPLFRAKCLTGNGLEVELVSWDKNKHDLLRNCKEFYVGEIVFQESKFGGILNGTLTKEVFVETKSSSVETPKKRKLVDLLQWSLN
jgi:hypothetical protein